MFIPILGQQEMVRSSIVSNIFTVIPNNHEFSFLGLCQCLSEPDSGRVQSTRTNIKTSGRWASHSSRGQTKYTNENLLPFVALFSYKTVLFHGTTMVLNHDIESIP